MIELARKLALPHDLSWQAETDAARVFYCQLLGAREIPPRGAGGESMIRFVVGGVVIETGHMHRPALVVVPVKEPEAVAARCWNAGYTVVVDDVSAATTGTAIGVLDPFGLHIELRRVVCAHAKVTSARHANG